MKTKDMRRYIKLEAARERKMLKKYPWFSFTSYRLQRKKRVINKNNVWAKPKRYCAKNDFPTGWYKAFGDLMLKELDNVIREYNLKDYSIQQIKEKYGELRFYDYGGNNLTNAIIEKYSVLSRNICLMCGKPDVGYTKKGWVTPICKDCYTKIGWNKKSYEEVINLDDCKMAKSYSFRRFSKDGSKDFTVDISDTANLIRDKWNKKVAKISYK